MITIISAVLGFLGSMLPDAFSFLKDKADRKHELAILALQIEQQKSGAQSRLEEIQVAADVTESAALYKTYYSGVQWVDAYTATVRPTIAYAFFLLYATAKAMAIIHAPEITMQTPLGAWLPIFWGEDDQAIFAGIIAFFFGSRSMSKLRAGK